MSKAWLSLWGFCLSGFLATAQSNESALRLTGIISLPDVKRALLESPGPPRGEGSVNLGEGERRGRIEVLTINDHEHSVEAADGGRKVILKLELPDVKAGQTARSNLRLSNANLQQVLDVYAMICGRTVLQHPTLTGTTLSLDASAENRTQAAIALEKLFQEHGLASIPDGGKFIVIIPAQLTNMVATRPSAAIPTASENTSMPGGRIYFENAALSQALAIYGDLINRKLVKSDGLRTAMIRLRTVNDLTRAEAAYALETLFRWNGLQVIPVGDTEFKAAPISPSNQP